MGKQSNKSFALVDLENIIKDLYIDHPLFGEILTNVRRSVQDIIPTACVMMSTDSKELQLVVNPKYMGDLDPKYRISVIVHECYHLIAEHLFRMADEFKSPDKAKRKIANIAADCSNNQIITKRFPLPEGCVTLDSVRTMCDNPNIKEMECAEYYYDEIMKKYHDIDIEDLKKKIQESGMGCPKCNGSGSQKCESCNGTGKQKCESCNGSGKDEKGNDCPNCNGSGSQPCQSCDGSGEETCDCGGEGSPGAGGDHHPLDGLNPLERMKLAESIEKAIDRQQRKDQRNMGSGAGDCWSMFLPKRVRIDKRIWKRLINRVMGSCPTEDVTYKYGIQSRSQPEVFWGKRHLLEDHHVYVGIDTSGSIQDIELQAFIDQINTAIKTQELTITLIQCDWDIQKVERIRKIKKSGIKVHGRGGTDLTKVLDKVKELHPKGKCRLVMLTDGQTPWRVEPDIDVTVIYTKNHSELQGIHHSATIEY